MYTFLHNTQFRSILDGGSIAEVSMHLESDILNRRRLIRVLTRSCSGGLLEYKGGTISREGEGTWLMYSLTW